MSRYDLHIKSVRLSDEGVYTCVDKAGIGVSASARLTVLTSLHTTASTLPQSQTSREASANISTTVQPAATSEQGLLFYFIH